MQTDPIGYKDGMNWYAYTGNDPTNKTDPMGLAKCTGSLKEDASKCAQVLDDSDKARDTARSDAKAINELAGKVKNGTTTSGDDAALKGFGAKGYSTDAGSLNNIADKLNAAADKIGARGKGMSLRNGGQSPDGSYAEAPRINWGIDMQHRGATMYDTYFNLTDSSKREQIVLHESMHNIGIYGDEYDKPGVSKLIGTPEFLTNADTYACIPYASACGY